MTQTLIVQDELDAIQISELTEKNVIAIGMDGFDSSKEESLKKKINSKDEVVILTSRSSNKEPIYKNKSQIIYVAERLLANNIFARVADIIWPTSIREYINAGNDLESKISESKTLLDKIINDIPAIYNKGRDAINGIKEDLVPLVAQLDRDFWDTYIEMTRNKFATIPSCSKSSLKKSTMEEMLEEKRKELEIDSHKVWGEGRDFKPAFLAREIQNNYDFIALGNGGSPDRYTLYFYDNGVYKPNGESMLHKLLQSDAFLGNNWKKRDADETVSYIKRANPQDPIEMIRKNSNKYPNLVNCKNGMVDVFTGEKTEHNPIYNSLNQLDVEYDSEVKSDKLEQVVRDILIDEANPDETKVDLFYEFLGWTIYNGEVNMKKMLFLLGKGDNGKSVLLTLINSLLGSSNYSSLKLQDIAEDQFAAAGLFGKLANINGDLDSTDITETSLIKQLTGGDIVEVDQKYKERLQFRNRAKLIFALNSLPVVRDYSSAFFERLIILSCPNTFRPGMEKYDPNLMQKITTEEVKSALFNKALEGLNRLKKNDWQFTECKSSEEQVRKYQIEANLVMGFLKEMCEEVPGAKLPKQELYDLYLRWCHSNNYHPFSKRNFLSKVRDNSLICIKDGKAAIDGKNQRVFQNIKIDQDAKSNYYNNF
jgi:putative DNA primase/helicase